MKVRDRVRGQAVLEASRIEADPRNPRKHPERQRKALGGMLREVGSVAPLVVWVPNDEARASLREATTPEAFAAWLAAFTGTVRLIDGHLRHDLLDQRQRVTVTDLDEHESGLVLATFDPLAALAKRSEKLLADLLEGIELADDDAAAFVDELLGSTERKGWTNGDDELRPEGAFESKSGEVYQLGRHTLLCGDARSEAATRLAVDCATLVYDPPWDAPVKVAGAFESTLAFSDGRRLKDVVTAFGPPDYVWVWDCVTSNVVAHRPHQRMKLCAFYGDVTRYNAEGALFGEPQRPKLCKNRRGSYQSPGSEGTHLTDLFKAPITSAETDRGPHPHGKPVDWVRCLLANCTRGRVFDPFAGGGTTLYACELLGRDCVLVEAEPRWCDAIRAEWAKRATAPRGRQRAGQ